MSAVVTAVGVPIVDVGGPSRERGDAVGESVFMVRLGGRWAALDGSAADIWQAALLPVSRDVLEQVQGVPEAAAEVAGLVSAGLLVEAWEGETVRRAFLDLVPLPLSIGRGPTGPGGDNVVCGWGGNELVRLDRECFQIWSRLNGRRTVREAVVDSATDLGADPTHLVTRLPGLFAALLVSRAVALDAA